LSRFSWGGSGVGRFAACVCNEACSLKYLPLYWTANAMSSHTSTTLPPTNTLAQRKTTWRAFPIQPKPDLPYTMGDLVFLPSGSVVIGNTSFADGKAIDHRFGSYRATRPPGFGKTLAIEDGTETYYFYFLEAWYRAVPEECEYTGVSFMVRQNIGRFGLVLGSLLTLWRIALWLFIGLGVLAVLGRRLP
jgi:hypothetical protein